MVDQLIDVGLWERQTKRLHHLFRRPLYTINTQGEIVSQQGALPFFCQLLQQKVPKLCNGCRAREVAVMKHGEVHTYTCHAGLRNIAIPIVIQGETEQGAQGALVLPALRGSQRTTDQLRTLAAQTGVDQRELEEYYFKISSVSGSMEQEFLRIFHALAEVLPDHATLMKSQSARMAEMKILLELHTACLSGTHIQQVFTSVTALLVQHLRMSACSITSADQYASSRELEESLRLAQQILVQHVLTTKSPILVTNLHSEALVSRVASVPPLAAGIFPINGQQRGVLCCYYHSAAELKKHFALLSNVATVLSSGLTHSFVKREAIERALTDPLTSLYNKRYMSGALQQELLRAQQHERPLSVMILDIDNFKNYNDTYGHQAGDVLLSSVARVMKQTLSDIEIVCRYGGEEFVVIMPEANLEYARVQAEKVRAAIASHDFGNTKVTASFGVCCTLRGSGTPHQLIEDADKALYKAKQQGKNTVVCYARVDENLQPLECF